MADIHCHVKNQALEEVGLSSSGGGDGCTILVGEANDGANVGAGEGEIYRDKIGVTLNFRTIEAGPNITVVTDGDVVRISTGSGGGIIGPDPSTLRAIATYADVDGDALLDNLARIEDSQGGSNYRTIQIKDPNDVDWRDIAQMETIAGNGQPGGNYVVLGDVDSPLLLRASNDPWVVAAGGTGRMLHEKIQSDWTIEAAGTIDQSINDATPVLTLTNSGTNPGSVPLYVGDRDPTGNVTASPGSFYWRVDLADSKMYQHRGAGTDNTSWVVVGLGDVVGPASATDEAIALYDGTTGKLIKNSPVRIRDIADQHQIQGQDTDTPATWIDMVQVEKITSNGLPGGMYVVVGDTDNRTLIRASNDPSIRLPAADGKIIFEAITVDWDVNHAGSISTPDADTTPPLSLETQGTNGDKIALHVGDRTPQAKISASPGDLYTRDDANGFSGSYQHEGDSGTSNDEWAKLTSVKEPIGGLAWAGVAEIETNTWQDIAYGGGVFIAVSSDGTNRVMRSVDFGLTWTAIEEAEENLWLSVAYGNGVFVAVSNSGTNRVMRSVDMGLTWEAIAAAEDNSWVDVAFGADVFVAVASNGTNRVMRSTDLGASWSTASAAEANAWKGVAFGDGIFVAVSSDGTNQTMRSTNLGTSWSAVSEGEDNAWASVTFGDGIFIAVATNGTNRTMRSTNLGVSWTAVVAAAQNAWFAIAFDRGVFVAVSTTGTNRTMRSNDFGLTWQDFVASDQNGWQSVIGGNDVFIAVAASGTTRTMNSGVELLPKRAGFNASKDDDAQTLETDTPLKVTYDVVQFDNGPDFAASTFTAPATSWYSFSASQTITMASSGEATIRLVSSRHGVIAENSSRLTTSAPVTPSCAVSCWMGRGETMEVEAEQSGSMDATLSNTESHFSGVRLIGEVSNG